MTSNSTRLLEHVRELVANGVLVDERTDALILRGSLPSADAQAAWLAFARDLPAPFVSLQVYNIDLSGDLVDGDAFDPARQIMINLGKPVIDGVATFVFQSSVASYLGERTILPRMAISDLRPNQSFRARGLDVTPWNFEEVLQPAEKVLNVVDPTRYVRDFVPDREIVEDLSPWILVTPPAISSTTFAAWEVFAARRLLGGLVSRAFLEEGEVLLQAAGPPVYGIRSKDTALPEARPQLTEAVNWVFLSGMDIEARHLLFSSEMARASRPSQKLPTTFEQALEGAKAAYEAHVQSASRETLKALADLRKTVIDETQKVTQRTQDLTTTLWRDLAVSAAPFALKAISDGGKGLSATMSAALCFAAAAFIALSFVLQWRTNQSFLDGQATSRQRWLQTLFNYISSSERQAIAEAPIEQATKNYRETRGVLIIVYIALVAALGGIGVHTLQEYPSAARNNSAGESTKSVPVQQPGSPPK